MDLIEVHLAAIPRSMALNWNEIRAKASAFSERCKLVRYQKGSNNKVFACLALVVLAGCSQASKNQVSGTGAAPGSTQAAQKQVGVKQLLADEDRLDDLCLGSNNPKQSDCDAWDAAQERLTKAGWCHGLPTDRSDADSYWHPCVQMGSDQTPAQYKADVSECESNFLQGQTYPDSFAFKGLTFTAFSQPDADEVEKAIGKASANPSPKELDAASDKLAQMTSLVISIPYIQQFFGAPEQKGTLASDFTSDGLGHIAFKSYMQKL